MTKTKKILHITESFGGGVTSAIQTYARHSTNFEHHLIASIRSQDQTGEEGIGFSSVNLVDRRLSAIKEISRIYDQLNPDVVHIHSTIAGVLVRLLPFIAKEKIVYTPHGYSFLRDDNFFCKKLYFIVEYLLKYRTQVIAGCGKDEKLISQNLIKHRNCIELINICDDVIVNESRVIECKLPTVAMVGRLSKQKGVDFFLDVAKQFIDKFNFVWIGGGDKESEQILRDNNVDVTGWIPRNEVIYRLSQADIYFHTAKWDGFPISVLEAAKLNIPIILRDITPFSSESLNTVESVDKAVNELKNFVNECAVTRKRAFDNINLINKHHNSKNLESALLNLYEVAIFDE
ncbi:glycosyltransferase [Vibrio coralliirubri]|uniref:glycosyltransferase n=1 Tax=Vibrio coralliirubri TaxID=1516159 RepID=UPI00069A144B|nr:glycosyltransferase [Vibrio coralliirubri]